MTDAHGSARLCLVTILTVIALPTTGSAQVASRGSVAQRGAVRVPDRGEFTMGLAIADKVVEVSATGSSDWFQFATPDSGWAVRLTGMARTREAVNRARMIATTSWTAPLPGRPHAGVSASVGSGPGALFSVGAELGITSRHLGLTIRTVGLSTASMSAPDTMGGVSPAAECASVTDAEATARVATGRLSFAIMTGARLGRRAQRTQWFDARLALALSRSLDITAAAGSRPSRPDLARAAGEYVALGLAIELGEPRGSGTAPGGSDPTTFTAAPLQDGSWRLSIRLADAEHVEIRGDMTGWQPLALLHEPEDPDVWSATLDIDAGVYLVALRIDRGPWLPPPGLAVVPDGFGGLSGLLQLR